MPSLEVLDGGMGHLLKSTGQTIQGLPFAQQFLGSTLASLRCPEIVQEVHASYIKAGCDIITTNNFVATPYHFRKLSFVADYLQVVEAAARCAEEAVRHCATHTRIAGSLPPLGESYLANQNNPEEEFEFYSKTAAVLAPRVDVLLCETMSSAASAMHAAMLAARHGKPVWVSFTLEDDTNAVLRSGEALAEAARAVQEQASIAALLVNCCAPHTISCAMPVIAEVCSGTNTQMGGYANGFRSTTSQWLSQAQSPAIPINPDEYDTDDVMTAPAYKRYARSWVGHGARIVGGCCGLGIAHIKELARLRDEMLC